jgi:hypothetical protein
VTNRPGARFGPRAIRTASHMLCDATHPYFDVSPTARLGDAGDLALPNTGLAAMRAALPAQGPPPLHGIRGKDCCESRHAMRCWSQPPDVHFEELP